MGLSVGRETPPLSLMMRTTPSPPRPPSGLAIRTMKQGLLEDKRRQGGQGREASWPDRVVFHVRNE